MGQPRPDPPARSEQHSRSMCRVVCVSDCQVVCWPYLSYVPFSLALFALSVCLIVCLSVDVLVFPLRLLLLVVIVFVRLPRRFVRLFA